MEDFSLTTTNIVHGNLSLTPSSCLANSHVLIGCWLKLVARKIESLLSNIPMKTAHELLWWHRHGSVYFLCNAIQALSLFNMTIRLFFNRNFCVGEKKLEKAKLAT